MDTSPLLGAWTSYDEQTTGILAVEIGERRGVLTVQVKDWDVTLGAAFGSRADPTEACGFTAHYRLADRSVLLAAYLNKRLLVVDAYTTFTDGRSNCFQRDHLYLR
ncbi:hypothetical protein [Actinocrispum wychmicini]|uniref:Uncharacterized protein n=1 Tax=Actinocrispum wychmicini TaxID=1213861 RepID=A0A4R2IPQ1_9PSEU|nr:hypothetical protein [Actinocrispum wychmicini]TCO46632.1 hypothetical protein EV192_11827 [Actinocrispum wychmicini]